jgi:hypothetical protein
VPAREPIERGRRERLRDYAKGVRPEYRQVARAAVGLKSRLRKLRLALRFRDEPDAVSQQSRPIPSRVEHAGEGWRPFAVPQAAALHLWRAVSSGLSYMPHSLVRQRTKEREVSEELVELAPESSYIFLIKQLMLDNW